MLQRAHACQSNVSRSAHADLLPSPQSQAASTLPVQGQLYCCGQREDMHGGRFPPALKWLEPAWRQGMTCSRYLPRSSPG
jgi:hypothetical protein